jgi:hypothetical protein
MRISMKARNIAALVVTLLGCSAMIGDLCDSLVMKGLGAAWTFAPFPKVFCDNQGLEGFASDFTIVAQGPNGTKEVPITPELYAQMRGPYNRRNVYGAVFSFAPKLPAELWESVFEFGLGEKGVLKEEFSLPMEATNIAVRIETKTRDRKDSWLVEVR